VAVCLGVLHHATPLYALVTCLLHQRGLAIDTNTTNYYKDWYHLHVLYRPHRSSSLHAWEPTLARKRLGALPLGLHTCPAMPPQCLYTCALVNAGSIRPLSGDACGTHRISLPTRS